jgi:glucan biosynthesis protein C
MRTVQDAGGALPATGARVGATARLLHLDAMRGTLMMLGVLFHAAQVFNPAHTWKIYSHQGTVLAGYVVQVIGAFRMPAFFALSGFFCLYSVRKHSSSVLITARMKRILIPFLATALTLNTLQAVLLRATGWESYDIYRYLSEGRWLSHLWFLENLALYLAAAYVVIRHGGRPAQRIAAFLCSLIGKLPMIGLLLFLPIVSLAILSLPKLGFPLYFSAFGLWDTFSLLIYAQFFAFGCLLFERPEILARFSTIPITVSGGLIVLALLGYALPWAATRVYCGALVSWAAISVCFAVFSRITIRPAIARYLAEISLTVYLFHHLIVISLGLVLIEMGVTGVAGFLLLSAMVLGCSIAIHTWGIQPFPALRLAFNGR